MRVLHVLDTVDPRSGGPIEAVLREAEVLASHGVKAEIATLDPPGHESLARLSMPVHAFGYQMTGIGRFMGSTFRYSPALVKWLRCRARDYDVVIAHGIWCYNTLGVARGVKGSGTPYMVVAHGMMDPWFRRAYRLKHVKKQLYWTLALGRAMSGAARVLFTAEDERIGAAGGFVGYQNYRSQVVAMGTADVPPAVAAQADAFYAQVQLPLGRRHILFLSRIHPKKGCDLLIEAFAQLAGEHQDVDLVIAGPDAIGWRTTLEALAQRRGVSDRIHWPGMLTGEAKWGAFRTAMAFALPSHQENFGIAVAEAMACGLPVLITPRINIWREIDAAGAGIIGEDDVVGTVSTLRRFLTMSDTERESMGAAARAAFEVHFDVRRTALGISKLLREVA